MTTHLPVNFIGIGSSVLMILALSHFSQKKLKTQFHREKFSLSISVKDILGFFLFCPHTNPIENKTK